MVLWTVRGEESGIMESEKSGEWKSGKWEECRMELWKLKVGVCR